MPNMTAGKLGDYLKSLPADTPIVLSMDSEGNHFSVLTDFGIAGLTPVADLEVSLPKKHKQALVIYPD